MSKYQKIANKYAKDVKSGRVLAGKWAKLACKRYEKDKKNTELTYNEEAVERVIDVIQRLPHVKGEWVGTNITLEPWQIFTIANIFGWFKDGKRRFRTIYLEVARKNAKSTLLAAIGIYLTKFDHEPGAEVYAAATKREQSKIVFDIANDMVQSSIFKKVLTSYRNSLHCPKSCSKFVPLAADYDSLDGLNIHGVIVDELHAHKTRDLFDVLNSATGSRRQPLFIIITTAGFDKQSICWEQHEYVEKILDGLIEDDTYYGIIYSIDEKDDWQDEKCWPKANPNLGISPKMDDFRQQAKWAKEIPSQTNEFLRKKLNVWTEASKVWIPAEKWKACGGKVDEKSLRGRKCLGGLDLASTTDLAAFVKVFPPVEEGERHKVICRFWIPGDNIHKRVRRDRVPYDVWVKQGYIEATDGDIIDNQFILHQISKDAEDFDLDEIAFDRWGSTMIIQALQDMGYGDKKNDYGRHLIDFGQGFASMAAPTKELEKMVLAKELNHGGNPVLAWMCSNVEIKYDPAGNMKPDKGKSREKIDGIVALIMAIDRASRIDISGSVYDNRGILVI